MEDLFFTVHASVTIAGQAFRPGVCYKLSNRLKSTIEGLASQGMAAIHRKEVRIVSGRIVQPREPAKRTWQSVPRREDGVSLPSASPSPSGQAEKSAVDKAPTKNIKQSSKSAKDDSHSAEAKDFF